MFCLNENCASYEAAQRLQPATQWAAKALSEGLTASDVIPWLGVPSEGSCSAQLRVITRAHRLRSMGSGFYTGSLYLSRSSFMRLEKGGHPTPKSYTSEKKIPIYYGVEKGGDLVFLQIGFLFRWSYRSAWSVVLFAEMSGYRMAANLMCLLSKGDASRVAYLPVECATVRVSTLLYVVWLMAHPENLMPMVGTSPLLNARKKDLRLDALVRLGGVNGLTLKNYIFTNSDPRKIIASLRIDPLNNALPSSHDLPVSVVNCSCFADPRSPDGKKNIHNAIINIGEIDSLLTSLRFISAEKWDFVAPSLHCHGMGFDCHLGIPSLREVIAFLKKGLAVSE